MPRRDHCVVLCDVDVAFTPDGHNEYPTIAAVRGPFTREEAEADFKKHRSRYSSLSGVFRMERSDAQA